MMIGNWPGFALLETLIGVYLIVRNGLDLVSERPMPTSAEVRNGLCG